MRGGKGSVYLHRATGVSISGRDALLVDVDQSEVHITKGEKVQSLTLHFAEGSSQSVPNENIKDDEGTSPGFQVS